MKALVWAGLLAWVPLRAAAQSAEQDQELELAKKTQNPIADLVSVPAQNVWDYDVGPANVPRFTATVQPVIPFSLSPEWNLITRTIVPIVRLPPVATGATRHDGLGDTLQSLFLSPKRETSGWTIGAGPALLYPTATDTTLGAEKWGAGPTLVVLRQRGGTTYGLLSNHVWSYAGHADRGEMNATFLQPFLAYTFKTYTTPGVSAEASYDWARRQWTIPVNTTVSQVLMVAGQPVSLKVGPRFYPVAPAGGPRAGFNFTFTLLFPK